MRITNFVLWDYGVIVLSRDFQQVDFDDIDQFRTYAGDGEAAKFEGLTDRDYLWYDPDAPMFSDSRDENIVWETPIKAFDDLIDLVPVLHESKSNPYFGMSEEEAFESARSRLIDELRRSLFDSDWAISSDSPLTNNELNSLKNWRKEVRDLAVNLKTFAEVQAVVIPPPPFEDVKFEKWATDKNHPGHGKGGGKPVDAEEEWTEV